MSKKALETFVQQKEIALTGNRDRRLQNTTDNNDRTEENLIDRIAKFQNLIKTDNVYGITLRFFSDVRIVNFPVKFNTKFIIVLQANINKPFKANLKKNNNTS